MGRPPLPPRALAALRPGPLPPHDGELIEDQGQLVWLHATSSGSLPPLANLISQLRQDDPDLLILVTAAAGVPTPQDIDAHFCPAPMEDPDAVEKFLDTWAPTLLVWTLGDLHPVLVSAAHKRGIKSFLVNAHAHRFDDPVPRWMPGSTRGLLGGFHRIMALDEDAQNRLRRLGAPAQSVLVTGNLAEGVSPPECAEHRRDKFAKALGPRPVWYSSSTPPDEIEIVLVAHRQALRSSHRLLLLLEVRPAHAAMVQTVARSMNLPTARNSESDDLEDRTAVFILDREPEHGLWMRVSPITYLGGSLTGREVPNPLTAAALGSTVIHGRHPANYHSVLTRLEAARASLGIREATGLGPAVQTLLSADQAAMRALAAWDLASSGANVTDRLVRMIQDTLDEAA